MMTKTKPIVRLTVNSTVFVMFEQMWTLLLSCLTYINLSAKNGTLLFVCPTTHRMNQYPDQNVQ